MNKIIMIWNDNIIIIIMKIMKNEKKKKKVMNKIM